MFVLNLKLIFWAIRLIKVITGIKKCKSNAFTTLSCNSLSVGLIKYYITYMTDLVSKENNGHITSTSLFIMHLILLN